ncbi:MAG: HAD hydrolase-like protein [Gammaproteobacteria bacterium]
MKHLIFDFDGTIVDSGLLIYKNLVAYTGNNNLTWDELRGLSSREVLSAIGVSKLDLPHLIINIRNDFKLNLTQQPIVPGMAELMVELRQRGFCLHIVSSNSEENIRQFLVINNLHDIIDDVTGFFTIFGKSSGIKKLMKKLKTQQDAVIYIGDESRDIEAARKAGIKCVAVTWGYNKEHVLMKDEPDYLAREVSDLLNIFRISPI